MSDESTTSGSVAAFRAGVTAEFPHIDQDVQQLSPHFDGTVPEFVAAHGGDAVVAEQLKNTVKKCPACGKANAYLLPTCNGCSADIRDVEVSYVDNIFTSFIFGIARGRFPYSISVRHQTPDVLVFDDLMASSPCHVNCIPTDAYIPDLRVLFEVPDKGLALVRKLVDVSWAVVKKKFLGDAAWRTKFLKGADAEDFDPESLRKHIIMGMNFPPSQYQLHLQVILPPFMPTHWDMYKQGVHFTRGRFVPVEFLLPALALQRPVEGARARPLEDIFDAVRPHGLGYDTVHAECYARYRASHLALAHWRPEDFSVVVVDGKDAATGADAGPIVRKDGMSLSSYGSPHVDGKYTRQFYKHAAEAKVPLPTL